MVFLSSVSMQDVISIVCFVQPKIQNMAKTKVKVKAKVKAKPVGGRHKPLATKMGVTVDGKKLH